MVYKINFLTRNKKITGFELTIFLKILKSNIIYDFFLNVSLSLSLIPNYRSLCTYKRSESKTKEITLLINICLLIE